MGLDLAIVDGARDRLRPVLMTAALAACALTLVLLPVMYRLYARRCKRGA